MGRNRVISKVPSTRKQQFRLHRKAHNVFRTERLGNRDVLLVLTYESS